MYEVVRVHVQSKGLANTRMKERLRIVILYIVDINNNILVFFVIAVSHTGMFGVNTKLII